jgi:glycosyltransferase involved in cell wall biosynthesis
MQMPPEVSVVIPTFNRAGLLGRALGSVESQTFSDFEVIIVDDGSHDDTPVVLENWRPRLEPRIHTIFLSHNGVAKARNAGIAASRGRFIAFLDSDDQWLPNHLEICVHTLRRKQDAGWVFTEHFIERKDRVRTRAPRSASRRELIRDIILRRTIISTSAVVVAREAISSVGAFNEKLQGAEDWELWVRMALSNPVVHVPEATVVIYQHRANFSQNPFLMRDQILMACEAILDSDIFEFCTKHEVESRAFLDIAHLFSLNRQRKIAWSYLVQAGQRDVSILATRDFLRTVLRISLPTKGYDLLEKTWRTLSSIFCKSGRGS